MMKESRSILLRVALPYLVLEVLLLLCGENRNIADAFQPQHRTFLSPPFSAITRPTKVSARFSIKSVAEEEDVTDANIKAAATTAANDQASKWKAEAERIRLEADQMDSALTLSKIKAMELKLSNKSWLDKHPDEVENLQQQLEMLNDKINRKPVTTIQPAATVPNGDKTPALSLEDESDANAPLPTTTTTTKETSDDVNSLAANSFTTTSAKETTSSSSNNAKTDNYLLEENPLNGYDQVDLDLYTPIVIAIEESLPENATIQDQLAAFRASPELQVHFQEKIRKLIVEPMEDMQRLEKLKQDYLKSYSSLARKQIKREMDQLEKAMEDESPFLYSDSIVLENLAELKEEEIQQRLEAVGSLHPILQALYKQRCGAGETGDLRLAVELDHFEPQIQLLEQVQYIEEVSDDVRHEIRLAILSLPLSVRNHFAGSLDLENSEDVSAMIDELIGSEKEEWMTLTDIVAGSKGKNKNGAKPTGLNLPEYNDLDFLDRSRFVQEFMPSISRLELMFPLLEDIDLLMKEVLDRKSYMVTSKPERVLGGYYIRGRNMFSDDENENNQKLVSYLQDKLGKSSLKDKVDLFYIQDPSPPTDEEYELGELDRPLLLVTAKSREALYNLGSPTNKAAISLLGIANVGLFGAATTMMQSFMGDQIQAVVAGDASIDLAPVLSGTAQVAASILAIQLVHELGHRVVASKDKFEIGLPTLVPSIQLGLQGAITPFKSPPPSNKSMFDFALAGPLAGAVVSLALLVAGMQISTTMDLTDANQLPAFPVALLRTSTLGGGIVDFFVGKDALKTFSSQEVLSLHPFAIAGFVGLISNALALLPLGSTDGGRIAQVLFGRRGAALVSIFTTLLLCAVGIFGLDEEFILLVYTLFAVIWQREPDPPALNEADELDLPRGFIGIGSYIFVVLTLLPVL